ncbi:MAG: hypothetical protein F6J93_09635 [Oscillatoria sp. SIO1A7]|nr:hypothetical protein [Oscillatoria sp. SIO1A7]
MGCGVWGVGCGEESLELLELLYQIPYLITHKSRRGNPPAIAPDAPRAAGAGTGAPPLHIL